MKWFPIMGGRAIPWALLLPALALSPRWGCSMSPADQSLVDAIKGVERSLARVRAAATTIEDLGALGLATDRQRGLLQSLRKVEGELTDMRNNCRYQLRHGHEVRA